MTLRGSSNIADIKTNMADRLTSWQHPRAEDRVQDVTCYRVGDEVEVQRVLGTIEHNTFNQQHDVACSVILGTDDCYMNHLHMYMQSNNRWRILSKITSQLRGYGAKTQPVALERLIGCVMNYVSLALLSNI